MSRKNEEARMILPNGWKYITVLDFEVGKVFQYEIGENNWNPDHESMEEFLSGVGHNLSNCEWMVHDSPEVITPY